MPTVGLSIGLGLGLSRARRAVVPDEVLRILLLGFGVIFIRRGDPSTRRVEQAVQFLRHSRLAARQTAVGEQG